MCAEWRTTACHRSFSIANYPMLSRPTGRPKLHFGTYEKRDLNAFNITDTSWEKHACNKRQWKSGNETGIQTPKKNSWRTVSTAVLIFAHDRISHDDDDDDDDTSMPHLVLY